MIDNPGLSPYGRVIKSLQGVIAAHQAITDTISAHAQEHADRLADFRAKVKVNRAIKLGIEKSAS